MIGKYRVALAGLLMIVVLAAACAPAANPTAPAQQNTAAPAVSSSPVPTEIPVTGSSPVPADTATAQPAAVGSTAPAATTSSSGGVTWTIVPDQSEARYRVREQLVRRDLPNDAVGKTNQVSGSITVSADGTIAADSKITVDVSTLATDERMRDNYVRRNILQTDQFPQAVFVPKSISGLPSPLPSSGQLTFQVTGDLTIRDVTKSVTWDVTGTINGNQAKGTATTSFPFEQFNLTQPQVPVVLSVDNKITLEADVTLQQQ